MPMHFFLGGRRVVLLCSSIKRNLRNKNIYMFLSASIHYIYIVYGIGGHHGCDRMVVGFTTTCGMQSVPITTKVVFESCSLRGVLDTTLFDRVCQ